MDKQELEIRTVLSTCYNSVVNSMATCSGHPRCQLEGGGGGGEPFRVGGVVSFYLFIYPFFSVL